MDIELFRNTPTGELATITGTSPGVGDWEHVAFLPDRLDEVGPELSGVAYRHVAEARAALAALDATAQRLPNPGLFRHSALRLEAQSTAALEGTYEPLARVLAADTETVSDPGMREVLNYVDIAETAYAWTQEGRPWSVSGISELHHRLMAGTPGEREYRGLRPNQVVVGVRDNLGDERVPIKTARYIPPPPGSDLEARLADLLAWEEAGPRPEIDPVVAAAMVHYTFEALHPFHDGNGRLGRLLVVLQLQRWGVLAEPTLTVSPWFEARRAQYYDALFGVSTVGDWSTWVSFFAEGLAVSARRTQAQMLALVRVQAELKATVEASRLRSRNAHALIDVAMSHPTFTIPEAAEALGMRYQGAQKLIDSLTALDVLAPLDGRTYARRYHSPRVMAILLGRE
ncbi:MAG: Fic family protein [Dermatophilus congolensis]|nr:Fic family protein [Dermatophilus congolensis]